MSTFGDSQVRNLIIDNTATSGARGTATVEHADGGTAVAGEPFRIKSTEYNEIRYSQIINPDNVISSGKKTLAIKGQTSSVKLIGTPVVGEAIEYVLYLDSYGAHNTTDAYTIRGWHKIQPGDSKQMVVDGLATSLISALKTERIPNGTASGNVYGIDVSTANISHGATVAGGDLLTVTMNRSPFKLGKFDGKPQQGRALVKFFDSGLSFDVDTNANFSATTALNNGVEIANLEWFTAGNVGDIYRGTGYPNNIDSEYATVAADDYELYELAFYTERLSAPGDKQRQMFTIATADATMITGDIDALL